MRTQTLLSILTIALFPFSIFARPDALPAGSKKSHCPPFSGNFTIHAYQLYPENGDFDFNNCVFYIGILWNASLGVYDPYTESLKVVEFEGISHHPEFHVGGVQYNHRTDLLSIVVDAGAAFNTNGQDISGTNYIILWDPKTEKTIYKHNLTEISQGKYGGPQDIEQDPDNNVYVVNTFPSAIQKVSASGKTIETWYLDAADNHTVQGFGGLATVGWTLIANDQQTGSLYTFDMRAKKGTPTQVKVTPDHKFGATDAIHLPRKYCNTVLLVAENGVGFSVYRDKAARWKEAEYLGTVKWTGDPAFFTTATFQIGDAVYENLEPFADPGLNGPGTAGNRTDFLYWDVTQEIENLLV